VARRNVKGLETTLGYRFKSRAVLDRALTHASTRNNEVTGEDKVYVSRVRRDPTAENGLVFWCVCDNLRTGAALNMVRIAEKLVADHLPARG